MNAFRSLPFLLVIGLSAVAPAQNSGRPAGPLLAYRQLALEDFQIDDKKLPAEAEAETCTVMTFEFRFSTVRAGRGYESRVSGMKVESYFDPGRSWRRSVLADGNDWVLQHEQGHLDISEIRAREIRSTPLSEIGIGRGETPKDALGEIKRLARDWMNRHQEITHRMQEDYDGETDHGTRVSRQVEWTRKIRSMLYTDDRLPLVLRPTRWR